MFAILLPVFTIAALAVSPAANSSAADKSGIDLAEIRFTKLVEVGSLTEDLSNEQLEEQIAFLNKCLSGPGRIIDKITSSSPSSADGLQGRRERTTYTIGWARKPYWLDAETVGN